MRSEPRKVVPSKANISQFSCMDLRELGLTGKSPSYTHFINLALWQFYSRSRRANPRHSLKHLQPCIRTLLSLPLYDNVCINYSTSTDYCRCHPSAKFNPHKLQGYFVLQCFQLQLSLSVWVGWLKLLPMHTFLSFANCKPTRLLLIFKLKTLFARCNRSTNELKSHRASSPVSV